MNVVRDLRSIHFEEAVRISRSSGVFVAHLAKRRGIKLSSTLSLKMKDRGIETKIE
jgi:hypothetical protein